VLEEAGFEQITRYARVDELFEIGGETDALSLLRHQLRYPDLNTIVARKPGGEGLEPFRARIELSGAGEERDDALVFQLAITNAGRSWWPAADDPVVPGNVMVGPYVERGDERIELPRAQLPHGVASGQTAEVGIVLPKPALADVEHVSVDLVREGIAWFSALGPAPLQIPLHD
jgi:hypothetical protein